MLVLILIFGCIGGRVWIAQDKVRGDPADIKKLDNGIYAVYGKMQVGDDIALWIVPLDSPKDLDYGKLYKLPKGTKSDFGPYIKKNESGEIIAYSFEHGK